MSTNPGQEVDMGSGLGPGARGSPERSLPFARCWTLRPGVGSGLCRYNAVTGEWLEDEVLIKMASQVSVPEPSMGTGLGEGFDCSSFQFTPPLLHAHFIVVVCIYLFLMVLLSY